MKIKRYYNFAIHAPGEIGGKPEKYFLNQWDENTIALINGRLCYKHNSYNQKFQNLPVSYLDALEHCIKGIILITKYDNYEVPEDVKVEFGGSFAYEFRKNIFALIPGNIYTIGDKIIVNLYKGSLIFPKNKKLLEGALDKTSLENIYVVSSVNIKRNYLENRILKKYNIPTENVSYTDEDSYYYDHNHKGERIGNHSWLIDENTNKKVLFQQYE